MRALDTIMNCFGLQLLHRLLAETERTKLYNFKFQNLSEKQDKLRRLFQILKIPSNTNSFLNYSNILYVCIKTDISEYFLNTFHLLQ
jgi:hypothetical protein